LFYKIYYDKPSILDIVNYIEKNSTENSICLFLEELFSSYIRLLGFFIDSISDEEILNALNSSNSKIEYVYLTAKEEKKLSCKIKNISGHKVIYGVYELRDRVSKINKGYYYYIDNTILDYYTGLLDDGNNFKKSLDPARLDYFRDIYKELFNIYTKSILGNELIEFFLSTISIPISYARSIKVKQLLYKIIHEKVSKYEVIDFIEKNTSERTYDLFCNELYAVYDFYENEFMFNITDKQFEVAIKYFKDSLEYIYVDKNSYNYVKYFTKKIGGRDAIFNVGGFSNTRKEKEEIKFIYLNELALRYFGGSFLGESIEGFEKIGFFEECVDYLLELNKENNTVSTGNDKDGFTIKKTTKKPEILPETPSENKLPRNECPKVFTSDYAFAVFLECFESFYHQEKNRLANFSFIFHYMKKDSLIHDDLKQSSYIDFIASKGVFLDRIKTLSNIGGLDYKKEIYYSNKDKINNDNVS
jgi:hypothetical protein